MGIEQELASRLKDAMRSKNAQELNVLRMVKTQGQAAKTAPGFEGDTDDKFWTDVIIKYVKQQKKAKEEFEKAGEQGRENAETIEFEIKYLEPFLPKLMGEDEVRSIVKAAIAKTGVVDAKMVGKVMGFVMKDHKGEVDAAMVKRIATEELS